LIEIVRNDYVDEGQTWLKDQSVYNVLSWAQTERGLFGHVGWSARKYICGDKDIRAKIERVLKESKLAGHQLPRLTPEAIVGSGGLVLGTLLVQAVPILGIAGAPVIAAVVVIIYRIGVDGFCSWAQKIHDNMEKGIDDPYQF
jgi:hypothetical protein